MIVSWSIYSLEETLRYDCLYYGHVKWHWQYAKDVDPGDFIWEECP